MPGFIDIVSFPTSDGALHQVYATVHEETDAKLTLEFDRPYLRSLLLSLRSRREEKMRRMGRRPFDVTLGVFNHPSLDGDSMGLAFAITEHIASFVGTNASRPDGSLVLNGIPRIIATGDIDETGIVQTVGGMERKLAGILHAIETGEVLPGGVFVYPAVTKTADVAQLITDLEAFGWRTLAVSHIDEVVPVWTPSLHRKKTGHGVWARWKNPLKVGCMAAVAVAAIAVYFVDLNKGDMSVPDPNPPPELSKKTVAPVPDECADLPIGEHSKCIFAKQVGVKAASNGKDVREIRDLFIREEAKTVDGYEDDARRAVEESGSSLDAQADENFDLGLAYLRGEFTPKNSDEAQRWFEKAAGHGHLDAQYQLGELYQSKNIEEALRRYRVAAKQGHFLSQFKLGGIYETGELVPQNCRAAVRWYRMAAEQGHPEVQLHLGQLYNFGECIPKNGAEAIRWITMAADQGSAAAQYQLGYMYENGDGADRNDAEAIRWYRVAAEQGNVNAQNNLGQMYSDPENRVALNGAEATRWLSSAAEQGYAPAQNNLGLLYIRGNVIPKDEVAAERWFRMASKQGVANSQYSLGAMYYNGEGVVRDLPEALDWFHKAAENGQTDAQFILSKMYRAGGHVPRNLADSARFLLKAAEAGHTSASFNLGLIYADGEGVPVDMVEAYAWMSLSKRLGEDRSTELSAFAARMTADQIIKARTRVAALSQQMIAK